MVGTPLNDTAIVEKAMELYKNTGGKVGGAVLAYYDRLAGRAVGGMIAQAAAPVVLKTDPSGKVEVLLRAAQVAQAHKQLQMDTALRLIEGFAKAGAVAIAGSLAGGLLMLAAAAAPAVFGVVGSVSAMSAEGATALALRLAPQLMAWAARNPYLAEAAVTAVVSTVLEVAETGTVDPMGVVFNLLHVHQTRLQTRPPTTTAPSRPLPSGPPTTTAPSRPLPSGPPTTTAPTGVPPKRPVGFELPHSRPPAPASAPAPEPQVLTYITPSRRVAGFARGRGPAPAPVPLTPDQTAFTQMPRAQVVQGDLPAYGRVTPAMTGQRRDQPATAMAGTGRRPPRPTPPPRADPITSEVNPTAQGEFRATTPPPQPAPPRQPAAPLGPIAPLDNAYVRRIYNNERFRARELARLRGLGETPETLQMRAAEQERLFSEENGGQNALTFRDLWLYLAEQI
jgi:hypothetical protein